MVKNISDKNSGFWDRFFFLFGRGKKLAGEKVRLEAFLAAFPGEYCGWDSRGEVVYSQGFCEMIGLDSIEVLPDIQCKLSPGDAAALEGVYNRLEDNELPFSIYVRSHDGRKIFKISGSRGRDPEGLDSFNILWIEDETESRTAYENLKSEAEDKELRYRRFEKAFNSILSPRWLRDGEGHLTWVNKVYSDIVGHTPRDIIKGQVELTGKNRKTSGKDKIIVGHEQALKAFETKEPQEVQVHVNVGGKRLLMRVTEIPIMDAEMTLGVAEDISAQEEAQLELKRYQNSSLELMGHLRSAISVYGHDMRLEFYNGAFAQLWGLEDGWLNTKPSMGDVMEKLRETRRLPEQADFRSFKDSWLSMFTTLIDPHEDMLYLPDGSAIRMLVIPNSIGGLMMNFEDVTSRLELESSYNTLIAVQKETLDNLGEAVAVYGGDGRLKLSNPAFGRLWGLNPEDLDGEPHINTLVEKHQKYFDEKDWPKRREELIAKALDRTMHEGRLTRSDDTHIDFSTVPLPDGGVLITHKDVSDTVHVENALREKNSALEDAERLKLDFLANVSYQLRTPLNAIMGFNEILDQEYFGQLNEKQKEYTRDVNIASEKLLTLVDDILDLTTLEAGYMELQLEDVSIYSLLNDEVKALASDWARKGDVELHVKCPKNIGRLMLDRKRIKQAVINVIRNAVNFTPKDGRIDLQAKRVKEGVEIIVKDSGVGMPKEERRRIFAPFERARGGIREGKTSQRGGAGLGLALVKNIIDLHNGRVDIESEEGVGTTVSIFLPCSSVQTPLKINVDNNK